MFLKSLEIRGFKSFADKTELKFKKGVTAVVGPNGSGKSNISDSVRWVLGEQSVKTLRGGKMEDVIFAGTQYRKPVGLAQVSLTLDNEDGGLSTEYNEVTISRRIFRSGETEYLINGTKCRLKDITQLFMDTGIGKEGYSLIGQGKIEAILSGKPEERRSLIEEAAGIVKYKSRKEEAEKKLDNTEDNIIRIRDIISTYEERLEPLRIEREKALKYTELDKELKEKEVSILVHNIKNIENKLNEYNKDLEERQEILNNKKAKLLQDKDELNKLEEMIEEINRKNEEERREFYNQKEDITKLQNDILLIKERINNTTEALDRNQKEIDELKENIKVLTEEKLLIDEEVVYKKQEQEKIEEELKSLESSNNQSIDNINNMEEQINRLKNEDIELLKTTSEVNNSISILNNDLKTIKEKEDTINSSIVSYEGNIKINTATIEGIKTKIQRTKSEIDTLESSIVENKKGITSVNISLGKKDREIKEITKSINGLEANKNMLINLEQHYEGYNRSVKTLMDRIYKGEIKNAEGTKVLGEIFTVDKEYEVAVEIALGAGISNVITETDIIAKNLINYLKNNKLGRATFLPLNNIRGNRLSVDNNIKSIEGYIGIAADVVKYPEKYEKAINNALGRTIVAKDMDSALVISKRSNNSYRIVTLQGEIIAPGGALTGGSMQNKHTNILGRKREIEEISINLENKKGELVKLNNEFEALRAKVKELDDEILNDRDKIHEKSIEITKSESEMNALKNEVVKINQSLEIAKAEIKKNNENIEKINVLLEDKKRQLNNIQGTKTDNKDKIEKLENELDEKRKLSNENREKITNLRVKKASLDEVIVNKVTDSSRKQGEIEDKTSKINYIKTEIEDNKKRVTELNLEIKDNEVKIEEGNKRLTELEQIFKDEEIKRAKLKEEYKEKDSKINEVSEILNKEEGELNKSEIQKAKSEMERDSLYEKLNEELSLTLAEAEEIAVDVFDVSEFKSDISKLKARITAIGTVNLAAIEEYLEVKEKYEFMHEQEEDLEKAKKELLDVIEEMTETMKEQFKENFKILNKNFNETFKELFKGGNAELILAEGDELEANIDINVCPPGKKLQNINLMSGGEKVLSAIALMFAILKMKPTPFCILDEIEAALDDANVYRYAEFLKEFSKDTQFIVITHRKGTMEASDVMYGVTMQEKGVSKVVSVDLSDAI